jgi:hypothetical protein
MSKQQHKNQHMVFNKPCVLCHQFSTVKVNKIWTLNWFPSVVVDMMSIITLSKTWHAIKPILICTGVFSKWLKLVLEKRKHGIMKKDIFLPEIIDVVCFTSKKTGTFNRKVDYPYNIKEDGLLYIYTYLVICSSKSTQRLKWTALVA